MFDATVDLIGAHQQVVIVERLPFGYVYYIHASIVKVRGTDG